MRRSLTVLVCALALTASVPTAQDDKTPKLTDVQRLTVVATVQRAELAQQRLENAQLRAQAAARDVDVLLKSLQVQGYTLDLETMAYVPKAPAK